MHKNRFHILFILAAVFGVLALKNLWTDYNQVTQLPYSEFQQLLEDDKIKEVSITEKYLHGTLKEPLEDGRNRFVTARVKEDTAKILSQKGIEFHRVVEETFFKELMSWVLPVLLFFGLWILLMRRMSRGAGGGLMSIGKSKAKVYVEADTKVCFDDVAGVDESKEELLEIVNFLKDRKKFSRLGARMPKGVLLVGPPGTGKTLLAKAVAGEAKVPFFSISGSEFVEMFVGVGAARVRDLFEQARGKAPCIIFIDELDALGRSRSAGGPMGGHDEKEQTLNQLLVELDGFDSASGIVLLGATNRPEILDPALLRAGRFDRQILVDRPDRRGRLQIRRVHAKKVMLSDAVQLEDVASLTPGFTGADLANLINEAALIATRREAESVAPEDFTVAVERIVAGLEKRNRLLNEHERNIVAHHEMGHALVAAGLPSMDKVHKVSIIPRGVGALGYTIQRPTEERYLMTQTELENKMVVLLGGRAAEKIIFDHLSTGAADDISKATQIARDMVTRYGMDANLGHVTYEEEPKGYLQASASSQHYSEESARKIDASIKELVNLAMDKAVNLLTTNLNLLRDSAKRLLEVETLEDRELEEFFAKLQTATVKG